MNQLIISTKPITSMQVAEIIGKQHSHIMRDIRDEVEKLEVGGINGESKFGLSSYTTDQNKVMPCYQLSKEGVLQLAARYDAVVRAQLIELAMRQDKPQVPQSFAEALRLAADLEEQKQALLFENSKQKQIIGELKPKADYTDSILKNKGLVTITQIAKDYGMSGQEMNDTLHDLGVQYKQSGQWLLYLKYHDKGYTHSETIDITRSDGRPDVKMNTKWTQKGRLFIYALLKKHDILPLIEQEILV